jgi:hypothetical protein
MILITRTRKWQRAFTSFLTEATGTRHSPFVSALSEPRSLLIDLIAFVFPMMARRA